MNYEGRNRRLQGLATAILKLWEKSLIAKIAIKFGVRNTDNELMANELKANIKMPRRSTTTKKSEAGTRRKMPKTLEELESRI
ncbi:hypothetical protein Ahy_A04g019167 [Arachis hypogaea]|uniref:Uncharacterized protein n=1 Tax=Arachis hypogaea TaxID=3818 RepID=A0A445DFG5_ARAHY|nr:hypothetical protein Ahy_A04g019167 [Arachis hypogaea]